MKLGRVLLGAGILAAAVIAGFFVLIRVPAFQDFAFRRITQSIVGQTHAELFDDRALRVLVCGSSSPIADPARAKACIAVIAGGQYYLVDVGPESYRNLALWRIPGEKIGGVFLTHLHSDHIGELGEVNLNTWGLGRPHPLKVYGPPGVEDVVAGFSRAYEHDREFRIAHHGADLMSPANWPMEAVTVVMPPPPSAARDRTVVAFDDGKLRVTAIEVKHTPVEPAYAYRFDFGGRSVVVSGDTAVHPPLAVAAKGADVLFHEAQAQHLVKIVHDVATEVGNPRVAKIMNDIMTYHTSPVEAAEIANQAGVQLLVLYHFTPPVLNAIAAKVFTRGIDAVRPTGWIMADDGTLLTLPVGAKTIDVGKVD